MIPGFVGFVNLKPDLVFRQLTHGYVSTLLR